MIKESTLKELKDASDRGNLLPSAHDNIKLWLTSDFLPRWAISSILEMIEVDAWSELNDRFYQNLSFGTGGMRSRTIGKVVTSVERGLLSENGTPAYAAIGTNMLNDFNIIRATIGLYRYCKNNLRNDEVPGLVIAHDVRHFSRHFCLLSASTWRKMGGKVFIFDGPRSTPQLSFSVRYLGAIAGIVITASHNPPYDNGFKVYYQDGGQVVPPHSKGIIDEVNKVKLSEIAIYLQIDEEGVVVLEQTADNAYLDVVLDTVLDPELIRIQKPKVVYSPLHGVGQVIAVPAMIRAGVDLSLVESQMVMDPLFSTIDSPNPENGEALSLAIQKAEKLGADAVIATDPDGDRMGVAVRDSSGKMVLINGNSIGSLFAEYRISKIKKLGWIPQEGTQSAALIKTFVTTGLQEAIAKAHGLKVINTLTGFKWIGEKLHDYETQLLTQLDANGYAIDYNALTSDERRRLLLQYSTYYVFGGEESYGYLADDRVRDKDANAAAIQFCELVSYLKQQGVLVLDYLDQIYLKYGYYCEDVLNLKYDGAAGSEKIKTILRSYRQNPPKVIGDVLVSSIQDFGNDEFFDADMKLIPKENFYYIHLNNGCSYAVRGSGTEPKIKFYLFAREDVSQKENLSIVKRTAETKLAQLKIDLQIDTQIRSQ